ncbi:hypothetical protein SCP_1302200 [Sparassis crispa]|uniref:Uncharacterized protein n=1 Tax=Sparassis crispa TaxID=139825 RepID=A0A401H1U7_9APHY|nr:hypothetical protein SCP_1302200 [Sparassis crispa]GBE88405.1 hypothetical protein SCP_1302200 [Sparassis crispa]
MELEKTMQVKWRTKTQTNRVSGKLGEIRERDEEEKDDELVCEHRLPVMIMRCRVTIAKLQASPRRRWQARRHTVSSFGIKQHYVRIHAVSVLQ